MVTALPIEGNSDCRARPFHSELYFDMRPCDNNHSFGIHLDCSRARGSSTLQAMVPYISARHGLHLIRGISGDSFILLSSAEARSFLDALFRISEGFYFGPHHLIMVALLYFEDKVHRKKLQRADTIPLLFSRLLCHILEHMGYLTEPHLERRHHCREYFTLNQWTQLAGKNLMESAPEAAPPRLASPMPT
ncbi:hypothetical protein CK203_053398 [Vitis vinifera]|uniref:Uncharacterized protein n=1 Tax=Vitis vinifera TaxID=29760 RepID=A0A438GZK3_VITVI|nr:hypothetical protein CK203_053398 [Vitis vinifera]